MEGTCPPACGSWLLESPTMMGTNGKSPKAPGREVLTQAYMTFAGSGLEFTEYLIGPNLCLPSPKEGRKHAPSSLPRDPSPKSVPTSPRPSAGAPGLAAPGKAREILNHNKMTPITTSLRKPQCERAAQEGSDKTTSPGPMVLSSDAAA